MDENERAFAREKEGGKKPEKEREKVMDWGWREEKERKAREREEGAESRRMIS